MIVLAAFVAAVLLLFCGLLDDVLLILLTVLVKVVNLMVIARNKPFGFVKLEPKT